MRLKGQTLIELLIASAVISTGLFAAATLVFSNLQLSDRDADEVIAVNLAREGVEQAKALRDANWLAGKSFDEGLYAPGDDYTATPLWNGATAIAEIVFDFAADDISDAAARVRQSADPATPGFFTQSDPNAPATPWNRLLSFSPICDTGAGFSIKSDGQNCGADQKVGIRVGVRIQWKRKGKTFERKTYDDLFDWR